MNIDTLVLVSGLAFLAWFVLSATTIARIFEIRRKHTTWISALPSAGRVEVIGLAGQKTLESPITKSPCVLWQLEVKDLNENKNSPWSTVYQGSSSEPFEIYDDTGRIQIRPAGADLILREDSDIQNSDTQIKDKLAAMGISTTTWLGANKSLRVIESLITPGEEVYVTGEVKECEGCKAIGGNDYKMIISDQSKRDLLAALHEKLAINVGIVLVGAIALLLEIVLQM